MDVNEIWNKIIPNLEKSLNRPFFEALISSTKPLAINQGIFQVAVPGEVIKKWLSKHCVTLLEQEIISLAPEVTKVVFVVGSNELFTTPILETETDNIQRKPTKNNVPSSPYLNQRYTFETFVVGHGNRFAHAASLAVAEAPAKAYNPLFLYGGVGLGKTHLMQAIGHHLAARNPRAKIIYISSETFTNELINSIRFDSALQFRNKYRNIDLLMIDDIQFIAGKERTQEEFFHTFNALHGAGKQIVVSSDRPPKEIPTLEERLRSRFEWGLTADIQAPDFETRIAILRRKAEISEINISDEICSYIAGRVISNIRELEGVLIRVVAFASLYSREYTPALVDEALKDVLGQAGEGEKKISIDSIKRAAAEYFNIRTDDLSAKIRTKEIANARQIAMYLARKLSGSSLPKIGESFGGRDHTTVMHACEKIKASLKSDITIQEALRKITSQVNTD
ncbi:chromosomal replication initiator protein DnaA [Candidatus Saganbacteria bacterium]|nr:chromosomal replication initiator protein DnaA [Candidatus Saganbacteria bacterium]